MGEQGRPNCRWATLALIASVVAVAAAISLLQYRRFAPAPGAIELASIPEGVSARRLGDAPVFITRRDRAVTVFLTDVQHLGGELLWWCPTERLFASPTHGELFDEEGRVVGGPAARGLTRLEATVRDGTVFIDLEARVESTAQRRPRPVPAAESGGPWNSGPGSFCQRPIRSDPT